MFGIGAGWEWGPLSGLSLLEAYAVCLILLLLPMAACVLLARRCGVTEPALLVLSGIAGSGLLGFAVFWVYLLDSDFGRALAVAVDLGCAVVATDACRSRFARWRQLAEFAPVTVLYAAAGLFYLALGYLHSKPGVAALANNRFLTNLPGDNYIPMVFAEQLESRHRPLPDFVTSDFQSSDRPPLQTDYQLLQDALLGHAHGAYLHPEVIGTLVQGLWIFGLWVLLRSARRPRWAVPLCISAVLFSGFAIVNSFFVWPKLVSAGAALAACAVLFVPRLRAVRGSRVAGALTGAGIGCSLLAHPGTAFAVIAVLATLVALRRLPRPRFLLAGAGGLAVSYVPWMLYQKFYQPPANALLELQLANAPLPVPGKSTSQAIIDAYRRLGAQQTLAYKRSNFATPFRHEFDFLRNGAHLVAHAFSAPNPALTAQAQNEVIWQFYFIGTTLGLIGLGLVILAARGARDLVKWARMGRPRRPDGALLPVGEGLGTEQLLLIVVLATYVVWCLIMFGPDSTVIHQGPHVIVVLAFALGVLGWWSLSARLAAAVVGVTAAFTLYVYLRYTPFSVAPGTGYSGSVSRSLAMLLMFAFAACLACLWWIGKQAEPEPAAADRRAGSDLPGADTAPVATIPTQLTGTPEAAGAGS